MRQIRTRILGVRWLRDLVQALLVARTVRPRGRFVRDVARDREGRYRARSLSVGMRARRDLQAAREHLSKPSYQPPPGVPFDPAVTLDLGANIGLFCLVLGQRHPSARVTAVEPDADSLRLLRANVEANGRAASVHICPAAAGTAPGSLSFLGGRQHLSRVAGPGEGHRGREVEVVDVMPWAVDATFVKIDIEGGEWPLLRDPRLGDVRATVAMEWHAFGSGADDPGREAERLLRAAGFTTRNQPDESGETGFVWAWRE